MKSRQPAQPPKVPRSRWIARLHRVPTRWDVLFHQLAEALARRYWYTQPHFQGEFMRLDNDELWEAAMHMSRAFAKQTSLAAVAHMKGPSELSIFDLSPATIAPIAAAGRAAIIRCLLNYLEVAHHAFIPRNHPDVVLIRPRLEETIDRFLQDKCMEQGELRPCLEAPAASDEGYFPASPMPQPPAPSGDARLDAYRLNVLLNDDDDAVAAKRKLLEFAMTDPLVAPEYTTDLVMKLANAQLRAQQTGQKLNEQMESIRIRDHFLFTPCRQRGLSPVELFAQQHLLLDNNQMQRLMNWVRQHVEGIFKVMELSADATTVTLEDLASGRETVVSGDGNPMPFKLGMYLRTRVVPWDECWRFSGIQQEVRLQGDEESLRAQLHPLRMRRRVDENDPRLLRARELVAFVHDRFVSHFGGEVARFENLDECREKLGEFHHDLILRDRMPDGTLFAETWQKEIAADFPPFIASRFAAGGKYVSGPAVIYDRVEGMAFLGDFADVADAVTAPTLQPQHTQTIRRLLTEAWKPGWLVQRILTENPSRGEELLREILGEDFSIDRHLDTLLGRLKCPDHTLPHRPVVFLSQ